MVLTIRMKRPPNPESLICAFDRRDYFNSKLDLINTLWFDMPQGQWQLGRVWWS